MAEYVKVANLEEVGPGVMKTFTVGGKAVVVVNLGGSVHAFADFCSHQGRTLSDGTLEAGKVTCKYHGSEFDVASGEVLEMPAPAPLTKYDVRVEDGVILLKKESLDQPLRSQLDASFRTKY
jgi:nitrite reductase/ring-hydroxylating ferredoxin subunit